mmetsp:Transcript_40885/g.65724  ORF Transcript_40885/g.65724 Transcript_40885/m.65724 type:complete len:93 (-) Transcript_40885:454-732(-)
MGCTMGCTGSRQKDSLIVIKKDPLILFHLLHGEHGEATFQKSVGVAFQENEDDAVRKSILRGKAHLKKFQPHCGEPAPFAAIRPDTSSANEP